MERDQRRYPRVLCELDGLMEVRFRGDHDHQRLLVPIEIRSLSPEGAGVVVLEQEPGGEPLVLPRDTPVTVRLRPGDVELEIPGRIAWRRQNNEDAPFDLGVRFQLELAPLDVRQAYARWIIGALAAAKRG